MSNIHIFKTLFDNLIESREEGICVLFGNNRAVLYYHSFEGYCTRAIVVE